MKPTLPSDAAETVEAKKYSLRQNKDGVVISFVIHPNDIPNGVMTADVGQRYMLAIVPIDDNEKIAGHRNIKETIDYVRDAGILCRNPDFCEYAGFKQTQEKETAAWLCNVLGIESRAELRNNQEAQSAYRRIKHNFIKGYPRDN